MFCFELDNQLALTWIAFVKTRPLGIGNKVNNGETGGGKSGIHHGNKQHATSGMCPNLERDHACAPRVNGSPLGDTCRVSQLLGIFHPSEETDRVSGRLPETCLEFMNSKELGSF